MIDIGSYTADEDLIDAVRASGTGRVRLSRPEQTEIVLGRSSKPELELNQQPVLADEVAVLRRRGGGCTVVLDPGNLVLAVVLPVPGFGAIDTWFRRISDWLAEALERAGFPGVERRGTSDLCIGDRKIAGSCIFRTRDLLYYSTTLLVSPDFDAIDRYLAHPPREPDYRSGRSHRDFLVSLAELQPGLDAETMLTRLASHLKLERLLVSDS